MKKGSRATGWALGLLALALLSQGCTQSVPGLNAVLAPPLPNSVVSYFNYASLKVNPTLLNGSKGFFQDGTYGYTTDNGLQLETPLFSATNPDTSGSDYALHLFGTYHDYGNGAYPAFELICYPVANAGYNSGAGPMFDASSFTGIKFYWNCPSDDNSVQRFFCLVTARIAPASVGGDGTCGGPGAVPCYDYLGKPLIGTGGNWFNINIGFSSMGLQYNSGSPTTVTATDKQQILQLMWTNRANNTTGDYTCDMWLDDVEFY